MLSRGYINEQQLQAVLAAQHDAEGRFGEWAQKMRFVTEHQVLTALSLQWSCPILALQTPPDLSCAEVLPWSLLCSLRMMPVRFVPLTRILYLAVSDTVENATLQAIEQMLNSRVVPCLVNDRTIDRWLESESPRTALCVQTFDEISGPAEMARVVASYAGRLRATRYELSAVATTHGPGWWSRTRILTCFFDLAGLRPAIFETNAFELTPAAV